MSELDDALARLHLCGFESAASQPNYGSIAVEALESLGHPALISGFLDVYAPRLPALTLGRPLNRDERSRAWGHFERVADWLASYERALRHSPWSEILLEAAEAVAEAVRLASKDPAATRPTIHGMVRVGYAVRSLAREDSPIRRRELAFALAYWSARGEPAREATGDDMWGARLGSPPEDALARDRWLSTVCLYGAESYLSCGGHRPALALGVVAPSAFRFLIPHLSARSSQRILSALILSLQSSLPAQLPVRMSDKPDDPEVERCAESSSEIRYRAACSVQEHAITMAEACLREDALLPDATLRRAAADAALRLSPPGYREWR